VLNLKHMKLVKPFTPHAIACKGVRKGDGDGGGIKKKPLSLIFCKYFFTFARRLIVFAYILLVNLST